MKFRTATMVAALVAGLATPGTAGTELSRDEVLALIVGHTEQGRVMKASRDDIGRDRTQYAIRYAAHGTLVYSTGGGKSGTGTWSMEGNALCRGFDGNGASCRKIEKSGDRYEGGGFRTGNLRYRFTISD